MDALSVYEMLKRCEKLLHKAKSRATPQLILTAGRRPGTLSYHIRAEVPELAVGRKKHETVAGIGLSLAFAETAFEEELHRVQEHKKAVEHRKAERLNLASVLTSRSRAKPDLKSSKTGRRKRPGPLW